MSDTYNMAVKAAMERSITRESMLIEAGFIENVKKLVSKIPGVDKVLGMIHGKNTTQAVFSLMKAIGSKVTQQDIEEAKKLNEISGKSREAALFDSFRNIKRTVMVAVLLTVISGITGKALAQMTESDLNNYLESQKKQYQQFVSDNDDEFNKFLDQQGILDSNIDDDQDSNTDEIPGSFKTEVDSTKVPAEQLKKAPIIKTDGGVRAYPDAQVKDLADSIITKDGAKLADSLELPFSVTVLSFDGSKLSSQELQDASKKTGIPVSTIKSMKTYDINLKTYKNTINKNVASYLKDVVKKNPQYAKGNNLSNLLVEGFWNKIKVNPELLKMIKSQDKMSQAAKEAIVKEVGLLVEQIL